jgi:hypothetical protein
MNLTLRKNKTLIMKHLSALFVVGLCLCSNYRITAGPTVSVVPDSQAISSGGTATVDIRISGLGNYAPPSLGAWDVRLTYDPSVASAISVLFGNYLSPSFQDYDLSQPGQADIFEVSFALPEELIAQQPDSFLLATVGFTGLQDGLLNAGLSYIDLADENGQTIPDSAPTFVLLALSCLVLWGCRHWSMDWRAVFTSRANR